MKQKVVLSFTALAGMNKVGQLKRNKDGYYEVILGALNAYNSYNAYYPYEDAQALFEKDADLIRRCTLGRLYGENGHPRPLPGMTQQEWFARVNDLYEPNLCFHIHEVRISLDTLRDEKGRPLVAVIGLIKPSGAGEAFLEKQLQNPKENVCFSLRSFTSDEFIGGILIKRIRKIVTYDKVGEPGIAQADKFSVPSLEALNNVVQDQPAIILNTATAADIGAPTEFSGAFLADFAKRGRSYGTGIGFESGAQVAADIVLSLETTVPTKVFVPASYRW